MIMINGTYVQVEMAVDSPGMDGWDGGGGWLSLGWTDGLERSKASELHLQISQARPGQQMLLSK